MQLSTPLFPQSLFRKKTQLDTSTDRASEATEIYSISMTGLWLYSSIHLITAESTLLLQHAPYHSSISLITTEPILLQQHQLQCCKCHRSYCRQHPYYLSIILIIAVQALLLHLKPNCCTGSFITITTITTYRYSATEGMQYMVA